MFVELDVFKNILNRANVNLYSSARKLYAFARIGARRSTNSSSLSFLCASTFVTQPYGLQNCGNTVVVEQNN